MNRRRSARLAKSRQEEGDLVIEENDSHHFDLTNSAPPQRRRTSLKRKWNPPGPIVKGHGTERLSRSPPNPNPSHASIHQGSFSEHGPYAGVPMESDDDALYKGDLSSSMNDSLLREINALEEQAASGGALSDRVATTGTVEEQNVVTENNSQELFGDDDDAELFEAVEKANFATTEEVTTKSLPVGGSTSSNQQTNLQEQPKNSAKINRKRRSEDGHTVNGTKKKKTGPLKPKKKKKGNFKLAFTNRKAIKQLANSASNELSKEDLSCLSNEEKLQLSSWGLPPAVLNKYRSKGITSLFEWQMQCLGNEKVLEGKNLVYSAPTSAGKTLVAEILMLKRVLELGRKAIMILPYVSVAREKVYSLQNIFGEAGVRVEGFMGCSNPAGGFKAVDIAICTIEKANSLINRMLEEDTLQDLGTLVVDELHLIGDSSRGYLLELLLTKIIYMTSIKNFNNASMNLTDDTSWRPKRYHIQVIGMSATLPNLKALADWLSAELYVTDFRPVPLMERIKMGDQLLGELDENEKFKYVRSVVTDDIPINITDDKDHIAYLTLETILNGFSVLIFCHTKASVEEIAKLITRQIYVIGMDEQGSTYPRDVVEKLKKSFNEQKIMDVQKQLKQSPGGADHLLCNIAMFGVAMHHSGLTYENRDIVETAFKQGIIKVIVATSTLSAGVNLPARRVIIISPKSYNNSIMDTLMYRQMCGRAGRNGIDTEGESILICPPSTEKEGQILFKDSMKPVRSALLSDGSLTSSMKRALLEAVASGISSVVSDVQLYAKCTFLSHFLELDLSQSEDIPPSQIHDDDTIKKCIEYLLNQDLIRVKHFEKEDKEDEYMPTQLGSACLAACFSPDDGICVYKELLKARECFVLENELHVIYQVTPIYILDQLRSIDWNIYWKIYDDLDDSSKKVARLIGISEHFIANAARLGVKQGKKHLAVHQRFYAALALSDLVNEMSLAAVGDKYGLPKGNLQNLQQSASMFAGMVTAFCGRLGWANLELLLGQFQERLEFGVHRELCDLIRLDCLNGQRARVLHDAGIKTVVELSATDPVQVEQILHKSSPFKSDIHGGKESSMWMIGKEILSESEAARKIVNEARIYIQIEMGQHGNIQFAFGMNDIPDSRSQRLVTTNKSLTLVENNSSKIDKDVECERLQEESKKSIVDFVNDDHIEIVAVVDLDNSVPNFVDDKIDGVLELETSQQCMSSPNPNPHNQPIHEMEDEMFEDSFQLVVDNFSVLYPKSSSEEEEITDQPLSQKFSPAEQIDQCESDKGKSESGVQHSTPVALSHRNQRFTLKPEEYTSPVQTVSFTQTQTPKHNNEGQEKMSVNRRESFGQEEIFVGLDEEFETSLNENFNNQNSSNMNKEHYRNQTANNSSINKLSESDAVIMNAMRDESIRFESEELFPLLPEGGKEKIVSSECKPDDVRKIEAPPALPVSRLDTRLDYLDGLDEEDFILTQGPEESEEEIFEDSSSESEAANNASTSTSFNDDSVMSGYPNPGGNPVVFEANLGKLKLRAKIIQSPDNIPDDFFSNSEILGIGLKLVHGQVKSTGSIAHTGIGSRVLGKKRSDPNLISVIDQDRQHSIALYNGQGTIWVLQWNEALPVVGGNRGLKALEALLIKTVKFGCSLSVFDCKERLSKLSKYCGTNILSKLPVGEKLLDPKIAKWIWKAEEDEKYIITRKDLIDEFVKDENEKKVNELNWDKEVKDAFFSFRVITELRKELEANGLWGHYISTEMPSVVPLLIMELNGFGLDNLQLSNLKRLLQFKLILLELKIYQLAGRQFSINSPKEVSRILYKEIGLKQPKGKKGTSKNILLKLDHELPKLIMEYRKVYSALHKVVTPFQQERNLESGRVHGYYSHFTCTGRVVLRDPSLQTVPRDFDIEVLYDEMEINDIKQSCKIKFGSKLNSLFQQLEYELADKSVLWNTNTSLISMRNVFIPCSKEFVIVAADYSQLELRILAHLSGDTQLIEALNHDTDVFVEIAAKWKNIPKHAISSSVRQDAKQIVYGVIYGMGTKALAEQLEIDEGDADKFKRQFMKAYPGVSRFLNETVKVCREKGYVETMTGRRRYLPHIHSRHPQERAKAERQAVNTQIQGSAADLVKSAMTRIHASIVSKYPNNWVPIDWAKLSKMKRSSTQGVKTQLDSQICFPILNLHDELIFEVRKTHLRDVVQCLRHEMETTLELKVKLPVVIKTGDTWGNLMTYQTS